MVAKGVGPGGALEVGADPRLYDLPLAVNHRDQHHLHPEALLDALAERIDLGQRGCGEKVQAAEDLEALKLEGGIHTGHHCVLQPAVAGRLHKS